MTIAAAFLCKEWPDFLFFSTLKKNPDWQNQVCAESSVQNLYFYIAWVCYAPVLRIAFNDKNTQVSSLPLTTKPISVFWNTSGLVAFHNAGRQITVGAEIPSLRLRFKLSLDKTTKWNARFSISIPQNGVWQRNNIFIYASVTYITANEIIFIDIAVNTQERYI